MPFGAQPSARMSILPPLRHPCQRLSQRRFDPYSRGKTAIRRPLGGSLPFAKQQSHAVALANGSVACLFALHLETGR